MRAKISVSLLVLLLLFSCKKEVLPVLGERISNQKTGDVSIYKTPSFQLLNQSNELVSSSSLKNKVKVVDFFFTNCPTICPKMTTHLQLVQDKFKDDDRVHIISYSIDGVNDTPAKLAKYAQAYQIKKEKWSLLTGNIDTVLELSKDYKVRAFQVSDEVTDLIHDGTFILVDTQSRVRGYYNGLSLNDTYKLIKDIEILVKE